MFLPEKSSYYISDMFFTNAFDFFVCFQSTLPSSAMATHSESAGEGTQRYERKVDCCMDISLFNHTALKYKAFSSAH